MNRMLKIQYTGNLKNRQRKRKKWNPSEIIRSLLLETKFLQNKANIRPETSLCCRRIELKEQIIAEKEKENTLVTSKRAGSRRSLAKHSEAEKQKRDFHRGEVSRIGV